MKNPIKIGDLGGFPPIFGSTSMKVSVEDSSSHIPGIARPGRLRLLLNSLELFS